MAKGLLKGFWSAKGHTRTTVKKDGSNKTTYVKGSQKLRSSAASFKIAVRRAKIK